MLSEKRVVSCIIIVGSILLFLNFRYITQVPYNEKFVFGTYYNVADISSYNISYDNNIKYVLYWSPYMNTTWDYYTPTGYGIQPFKECKYNKCFATRYVKALPLEKFSAIIFDASYYNNQRVVPPTRTRQQVYIYMNMYAPGYMKLNAKLFLLHDIIFNWTMTYRPGSDLVVLYGYTEERKTKYDIPSIELLKNKSGAAWFTNDCDDSDSKREVLVKELKKFFKIDIYGKCGQLPCTDLHARCYEMIEKKYKFYLVFEKYCCKDYITEELYNTLQRDIVPVVYNWGIEHASIPPGSVINVDDFDNVYELAAYLNYLDTNEHEYAKYFEWKKEFVVFSKENNRASFKTSLCELCKRLHEPKILPVHHDDLYTWWFGRQGSTCLVLQTNSNEKFKLLTESFPSMFGLFDSFCFAIDELQTTTFIHDIHD
ncbi:hypothetical protein ILUMI_21284 [Ignelater luminosus]|uniref:Fucosyltransferase n=1 Tax=Ignelater luminosus TaxID=2038154 RepID=A0A8K0CI37_IGNLU|nr:hypothetical protein ILUMI_21284 [Ignelater luminosus]